ncbi:kynureninase [Virgibacillus sp. MG-45]|uniref:kynureninase n=1 Tax=Virgibacillus sp. MG-45 TaxID=3102791 RepID=UPI002ED83860
MTVHNNYTQAYAQQLDKEDELAFFQAAFYKQADAIYFDGNSLGLLSKRAEKSLLEILASWKEHGIDGWMKGKEPWFYYAEKLGEMSAPLLGAKADEVIVTGSATANLHQLVATFFKPTGNKNKIVADELNFPTDIYALKSQLQLHGLSPEEHLVQVKSNDGRLLNEDNIIEAMQEDIALILLPSVLYRSGQLLDIERLTSEAHERDIVIGFDLCHSIGAIPHQLHDWGVDFACWCNYKHLNGGPGAVGGMYVNERHFSKQPGLAGWFGSRKDKQFDMEHRFTPAAHAGAFQMGTPHLLSAAPLLGSLQLFHEAGLEKVRRKSLKMTDYMMQLIEHELAPFHFQIANPREDFKRGGHVYIEHEDAARICKALKDSHVVPDFRSPNGIRLAPVALYNSFEEIWRAVQILKKIMEEKRYLQYENKRDVIA